MNLLHRIVVVVCGPGGQAFRAEYLRTIGHGPPQIGIRQHARLQIGNGHQRRSFLAVGCCARRIGEVARQKTLARWHVRINPASALCQPLLEPFVVSKHEHLVLLQGTPDRSTELVPFEWALSVLEEVFGIESAVTVILEDVAMPLVWPGGGHNADLPCSPLTIPSAIGASEYAVLPNRLRG